MNIIRVATYNIHKGVQGLGLMRRLEIHNLALAVESLDADVVCLQEVRQSNRLEAKRFALWPEQSQADFLTPQGYEAVYRTNAVTRHGEHGNALLSRFPIGSIGHHDVSDHAFEQRGLLHVPVQWQGVELHVVVAHLGLIHASRLRQVDRLAHFVRDHVPPGAPVLVAGDFNDWSERLDVPMRAHGLRRAAPPHGRVSVATFPSRLPVFTLDRVYLRGLRCTGVQVPRGATWARMSDHLPLLVELVLE